MLLDLRQEAVARTYPYIGNLPLRRYNLSTPLGIERTLLDLVLEALRCDLFQIVASDFPAGTRVIPRPPELLDLELVLKERPELVVYPDPPLPTLELKLLQGAAHHTLFQTLEEIMP